MRIVKYIFFVFQYFSDNAVFSCDVAKLVYFPMYYFFYFLHSQFPNECATRCSNVDGSVCESWKAVNCKHNQGEAELNSHLFKHFALSIFVFFLLLS